MPNFASFYYKELLQKMQIPVLEKYTFHSMDSTQTLLLSAVVPQDASPHTKHHSDWLRAAQVNPVCAHSCCPALHVCPPGVQ